MKKLPVLIPLCVFLTVASAFGTFPDWSETPISIKLLTNKEVYEPGEVVGIELRAVNTTDRDITLNFPDGHQQDYSIDGKYLWSSDKSFIESLTHVDIPAGTSYSWYFKHTPEDYSLAPGTHVIVGTVVGYGHSGPVPIAVRERDGLVVTVSTDKESYSVGENVPIHVTITNKTSEEIVLTFRTGEVAGYCIDEKYTQFNVYALGDVGTAIPLPGGGSITWDFVHDPADYPLLPGTHTIKGIVVGYGHSNLVTIVVGEKPGLVVTVSTDKESYSVGENVPIHVTITNKTSDEVVLIFRTGKQAGYCIDGEYFHFNGSEFTDVYSEIPLAPNGGFYTWDFVHDPADYPLTPGVHWIKGIVAEYGHSEPIKILVVSGLQVTVATDKKEYALDEPVQISVTATNTGLEPITLGFPISQEASYVIDGVYDWSRHHPALMVETHFTLQPEEVRTWEFTHTAEDYRLLPGGHSIVGVVIGYGKSEPTEIFVAQGEPIVDVSVSTDKEIYELGELVKINVSATNNSDNPVTLEFPTLHQADYRIDEAYLWSKGKFFLPIPTSITLPPGAKITWSFVHSAGEYRLLPGEHSIVGIVVGYGRSEPRVIVVNEKEPEELTVRGLLLREMPPWLEDGRYGGYPGYFLYTGDPQKVYCLFPMNVDLDPHVNKTVEVTGHYVYTLLPVPGIPLGVTSIRDLLVVEVQTDKPEYYQLENIVITLIARNVTEGQQAETLTIYIDQREDVIAWLDDIRLFPEGVPMTLYPYLAEPIEIESGGAKEWTFIYRGEERPLFPGEHVVRGEVRGYGKSGKLPIQIIEKPSEKIVASGIVSELPSDDGTISTDNRPEYVLVDRETGNALYYLRNPQIDFGWYLGQFVEVVGVLSDGITPADGTIPVPDVPELFVLSIRRLLAVAVSTDKITYAPSDPIYVYVTAKNCTPEKLVLTFPSGKQAYAQMSSVTRDIAPVVQEWSNGEEVILEPYGLHVWEFKFESLGPDDYTVAGGVIGYGQGKPVPISVAEGAPEIVVAKGFIEKLWWWKWFEPTGTVPPGSEIWPWPYPCRYVLYNPEDNSVTYFLSSHRVELDWYVGRYVQVTGYEAVEVVPMTDPRIEVPGSDSGDGIPPEFPVPPIIPPFPWAHLDVVSVIPLEKAPIDENGNGIPDTWEIITGLKDIGGERDEDSDGDGMPNIAEYLCGTDPLDSTSVVKVNAETNPAGLVILRWKTVPGKTYSVYCSGGWSGGEPIWRLLIEGIEGTGAEAAWTDDGAAGVEPSNAAGLRSRFYRVEVE